MTYSDWAKEHSHKRVKLQTSLESLGLTPEQIIKYFDYDNMIKHEPKFCGLYELKVKCHDTPNLNCYQCGCPYFKYTDTPTPDLQGKKRFSVCTINSKFAKDFELDNNIHCDCTDCTIPHTRKAALKNYEHLEAVEDTSSLLESIRAWQFSDIFGKYKLF